MRGFAAQLTPGEAEQLRADPEVQLVTRDRELNASVRVPLTAGEGIPTGVSRIGAVQSGASFEPSSVAVAVIDTGVNLSHPDLNVSAGANCTGSGPPNDQNGHGTMVAGVIGAKNNGTGSWASRLVPGSMPSRC